MTQPTDDQPTAEAPAEETPAPEVPLPTASEIYYARLGQPYDAFSQIERTVLVWYLNENPGIRLATRIRNAWPQLQADACAVSAEYNVSQSGAYAVVGEPEPGLWEGAVAYGLNPGEAWVARYMGNKLGWSLTAAGAWQIAKEHYLDLRGCPLIPQDVNNAVSPTADVI